MSFLRPHRCICPLALVLVMGMVMVLGMVGFAAGFVLGSSGCSRRYLAGFTIETH